MGKIEAKGKRRKHKNDHVKSFKKKHTQLKELKNQRTSVSFIYIGPR